MDAAGEKAEKAKQTNFQPEREAIARRRGIPNLPAGEKTYGLALSGGGIRSATFSLGVVRALAKQGKLNRYDYLSTVSGGGYLGGMLGRLYQTNPPKKVQSALGNDNTILLAWLRNNGRYLTPAGWHDISLALTQILRSFFSALLLVTLLCVLVSGVAIGSEGWVNYADLTQVMWLIAVPLSCCGWLSLFYWLNTRHVLARLVIAACIGTTAVAYQHYLTQDYPDLIYVAYVLFIGCSLFLLRLVSGGKNLADFRLRLTTATLYCLGIALFVIALWGINRTGNYLNTHASTLSLMLTAPSLVLLLRLLREIKLVTKALAAISARGPKHQFSLMQAANILGLILLVTTLVTVCAAEMRLVSTPLLWLDTRNHYLPPHFAFHCSLAILFLFALLCCTPMMISFLNQSSLHHLYRARLERAWLSVANVKSPSHPEARFSRNPLENKRSGDLDNNNIAKVTECMAGDDIDFRQYAPQANQGPIHLITCCINQTIDDRSGNYNADRKGIALTLNGPSIEIGTQYPVPACYPKGTTLSQWIAVSGAAFASGMGSRTQPGTAFLLFLTGGRLGYWSSNLIQPRKFWLSGVELFFEMFARFPGLNNSYWYLSDGGHFENTAVYPLLKRRVDHIVVTDCGADPDYIFDDLENLVRKAKIDMAIDIKIVAGNNLKFATQTQIKSKTPCAPLLKATISYPASNGLPAKTGELIIVKPHLLKGLDLATACYADRHTDFPQQTTGDQFFDEEQWEAYHQLGLLAGKAIP